MGSSFAAIKPHKRILENAGLMLILLGAIDTYLALWSYWYSIPYAPTFSIFTILAGILLFRGGLKTAKYLRIYALFVLPIYVFYPLVSFFIFPLDFQLLSIHLNPWDWLVSVLTGMLEIIFAFWLQRVLGRDEITNTQVDVRITPTSIRTPLRCGVAFTVLATIALALALHSDDANKAVAYARTQLGPNNKYFANSLHLELSDPIEITVSVIAYNSDKIEPITVRWRDACP